jgi:hypothetical protein
LSRAQQELGQPVPRTKLILLGRLPLAHKITQCLGPLTVISLSVVTLTSRPVQTFWGISASWEFPENPAVNPARLSAELTPGINPARRVREKEVRN